MRDESHAFGSGEGGHSRAGDKCGIGRLCRSPAPLNIPNSPFHQNPLLPSRNGAIIPGSA